MTFEYDNALAEIHDEMYQRQEQKPQNSYSTMDPKVKMWIGVFAAAILILFFTGKISNSQALAFGVGGGVFLWLMKGGEGAGKKELTYLECLIRLHDLLYFMQKHPIGDYAQIPKGNVQCTPRGKKQWYEGTGWKRSWGVKIYDEEDDLIHWYLAEQDVYTGDLLTFAYRDGEIKGDEKKDMKYIATPDMLMEKKRTEYIGKVYKK